MRGESPDPVQGVRLASRLADRAPARAPIALYTPDLVKIALYESREDPHGEALAGALARRGAEVVWVEPEALERGVPLREDEGGTWLGGARIDDVAGALVRSVPLPAAPAVERGGRWVLHDDWFAGYMQARERAALHAGWLEALERAGVPVVNPVGSGARKANQLRVLRELGAPVPRTLVTNDPEAARAFAASLPEVVFKPVEGGALARALDAAALGRLELLRRSPAIFQERVRGADVRVVVAGERVVSAVEIAGSGDGRFVDFREDPAYARGDAEYREVRLPGLVEQWCVRAARACGLAVAGVDLKRAGEAWTCLELNGAPRYLDVERKLGAPISEAFVEVLLAAVRRAQRQT